MIIWLGARIRTWEWRNQNPLHSIEIISIFWKKSAIGPSTQQSVTRTVQNGTNRAEWRERPALRISSGCAQPPQINAKPISPGKLHPNWRRCSVREYHTVNAGDPYAAREDVGGGRGARFRVDPRHVTSPICMQSPCHKPCLKVQEQVEREPTRLRSHSSPLTPRCRCEP